MEALRRTLPGDYTYPVDYDESGLEYEEMCSQPYEDCCVSAGLVTGHPVDTIYLRWQRDGDEERTLLLRHDEAAAIAWCTTGALLGASIAALAEAKKG